MTGQEELELLTLERERAMSGGQFDSIVGGAATGNPNIGTQGRKALKPDAQPSGTEAIVGAAGVSGTLGAFAPEIVGLAGRGVSLIPHPLAKSAGAFLQTTVPALRAAGRPAAAIAGAASGAMSEGLGQMADDAGAGWVLAEGVRLVGGIAGGELANAGRYVAEKISQMPSLSLTSKAKKEAIKLILNKLDMAPETLTQQEKQFVLQEYNALRGTEMKSPTTEQDRIGGVLSNEGDSLLGQSQTISADAQRISGMVGNVSGTPGAAPNISDIGNSIRAAGMKRFTALDNSQKAAFQATKAERDAFVQQREAAGQFPSDMPEYESLVSSIRDQLNNSDLMKRSPSVQANLQKILSDITNPELNVPNKSMVLSGQNLDMVETPGAPKPVSFLALDDARRKLGEAFAGKPPAGYEAISRQQAKELYSAVSDIQKSYADGGKGLQKKLLDDYAADVPGLQDFSSKIGKTITGLDNYREGVYATDAAEIPGKFFKSQGSVIALKQLLKNPADVENAALSYTERSVQGNSAGEVRNWMTANRDWLREVPGTQKMVDNFAGRLESAERASKNAADFAAMATKDAAFLKGNGIPAQRAIDLIKSGDAALWQRIGPAITQSTQAKTDMVRATRQVLSEMPATQDTERFFAMKIRPFLEKAGIATPEELNFMAKKLENIRNKAIPEADKLGLKRRALLEAANGWAGSAALRAGYKSMVWAIPE